MACITLAPAQVTVPSLLIFCASCPLPEQSVGRIIVPALPVSSTLCATFAVELKNSEVCPVDGVAGVAPFCPVSVNGPVLLVVSAICHAPGLSQNQVSPLTVSS